MSKSATLALALPSRSLSDRLLRLLSAVLDVNAKIAARNEDSAYFGL